MALRPHTSVGEFCGGWTTQLVSYHWPTVAQDYPQVSLSKLWKLFEGIWLVIITSIYFHIHILYFTKTTTFLFIIDKTNLTKSYLTFLVKSPENQLLKQCFTKSSNYLQGVLHNLVQRERRVRFVGGYREKILKCLVKR